MANGADILMRAAQRAGVQVCFANPGTTEMPFVMALDGTDIRPVLGLHENVCTGAADGYARIAGRPALTVLHLGPGFANGLANLHNARRAGVPVVNLIGEHASWHIAADPPLAMDIEAVAGAVSAWTHRLATTDGAAAAMAEAVGRARAGRGSVSTLIVPHDLQLAAAADTGATFAPAPYPPIDAAAIVEAVDALRGDGRKALFIGGTALFGPGLVAAGRIAARTGCTLIAESSYARLDSGVGRPPVERLPYFPEQAQAMLDGFARVVVCGAKPPVSFFGYSDKPSRYLEGRAGVALAAGPRDDAAAALSAIAEALGAREDLHVAGEVLPLPTGRLDPAKLCQVVAALQPEEAIVVPTAVTTGHAYAPAAMRARPHSQLVLTGGAIGEGTALAVGAAIAAPGRRVINVEADGSGAYLPQSLWTQAHEGLDVVTVICSNARYRILEMEIERAGQTPGRAAKALTGLDRPRLDWVSVARGFGVAGSRVDTAEGLADALGRALASPGPTLIEAML
jgi:acetolactate synthase-1/2/3 large subunit